MPIHLEIPETQIDFLKSTYEKKATELTDAISKLQNELKDIAPMLILLGIKQSASPRPKVEQTSFDPEGGYSPSFTWEQKAIYVLHRKNNLTSKEIIEILKDNWEPTLVLEKAANSLPATIGISASKGKLDRVKNEGGDYVYSLKK